jgi:hypothetical protein
MKDLKSSQAQVKNIPLTRLSLIQELLVFVNATVTGEHAWV